MSNKIKIVKITADMSTVRKGMTHSGRVGFNCKVVYELADGRIIDSYESSERKKDLLPHIESAQKSCDAGAMSAEFNDEGKFWGTVRTFGLGSGGLVPQVLD